MKSRKKRNYLKYEKCGKPHKINKNQNRTGEEKYDKSTIRMPRQYLYFSEQTVNGYTVGFKIAA